MLDYYEVHEMAGDFEVKNHEVEAMAKSIGTNGQLVDVELWEDENGKKWVIDGRVRQGACQILKIKCKYRMFYGTKDEADKHAEALNGDRRHADKVQRSLAAARRATRRQGRHGEGETVREAAKHYNVPEGNVYKAKKILVEGSPALLSALVDEVLSIKAAYELCSETWPRQDMIVADLRKQNEEEKANKAAAKANKVTMSVWQTIYKAIDGLAKKVNKAKRKFSDPQETGEDLINKVNDLGFFVTKWETESKPMPKPQKQKTPTSLFDAAERSPNGQPEAPAPESGGAAEQPSSSNGDGAGSSPQTESHGAGSQIPETPAQVPTP